MSFNIGVLNAAVTLDNSDFKRKAGEVPQVAESNFRKAAEIAAAYLTFRGIFSFVKAATMSFSALENAAWNFDQTFQQIPDTASGVEKRMRELYKLSEQTSKGMLSAAGDQLQAFGMGAEDSLRMAEQIAKRGIDLASYKGGNQADAVADIARALTGETEGMKKWGVVIRQGSKEFEDMVEKIQQTTGVTFELARAQAIFEIILKQTANANGDYLKDGANIAQTLSNIRQQTLEATSSMGAHLSGGVRPMLEGYEKLLGKFNELDPSSQKILMQLAAASSAMILLQTSTGKAVNAKIALAASNLLLGNSFKASIAGVRAFFAALGPLGWSILAVTSAATVWQHSFGRLRNQMEAAVRTSKMQKEAANELAEAHRNERNESDAALERIQELSKYSNLNNSEQKEAERLIAQLTKRYGDLGISLDATTGKLVIAKNAWEKMNEAQAKQYRMDLTRQLQAGEKQTGDLQNIFRDDLSGFVSKYVAPALADAAAKLKGTFDPKNADEYAQNAESFKGTDLQNEFDRLMKLNNLEEQIAGLEAIREKLSMSGDEEKAARAKVFIDHLKSQLELQRRLMEFDKTKKVEKEKPSGKRESSDNKEQRQAREKLESARLDRDYRSAETDRQAKMLDEKRAELEKQLFASAGNKPESEYSKEELEIAKQIVDLERQRAEIRKKSADAFKDEAENFSQSEEQRQRENERRQTDREISKLESEQGGDAVKKRMEQELQKARESAEMMKAGYDKAIKDAQADGVLTDEERKQIQEARRRLDDAMSDEDTWANKLADYEAKDHSNAKAAVAFSSDMLTAMIGASPTDKAIEKNTKQSVDLQRDSKKLLEDIKNKDNTTVLK